jgi:hypothetical protein
VRKGEGRLKSKLKKASLLSPLKLERERASFSEFLLFGQRQIRKENTSRGRGRRLLVCCGTVVVVVVVVCTQENQTEGVCPKNFSSGK